MCSDFPSRSFSLIFLDLFIFLTQIAVIAQRMCGIRLLCNSNLLFRLPLCTKEENMYWLNGLVMNVSSCEWEGASPLHKPSPTLTPFII